MGNGERGVLHDREAGMKRMERKMAEIKFINQS